MSSSRITESCTTRTGSRKPCCWPGGLPSVRSLPTRHQIKKRWKAAEKLYYTEKANSKWSHPIIIQRAFSTGNIQGQSQLPSQTQSIQPLSQAQSSQPLSQVHSSNLLSQTQCSQPCTSLIAVFSYPIRSYFIAYCLILLTTVQCVEIVFVIISCKTFRVKMERLLIFFCNTYGNDGNVNTQGHVCYKH